VAGDSPTIRVDRSEPIVVIEIVGELRLDTAHRLLATGLKELAEVPVGLVLDVGGMSFGDKLALTVISRWPARRNATREFAWSWCCHIRVQQRLRRLGMRFIDVFDSSGPQRPS
jgi:anti-anti-sigma regulatory factor